jgi:hypothetical protein
MARPRAISILAMVGLLSAVFAVFRRGLHRRHDRVDLYFDDGSMVSLEEGSPQAERLLEIARAAL